MLLQSHIVLPQEQPVRLSDYVVGVFEAIPSRKGMKKAIKQGLVSVNGSPAESGRFLHGGEMIELYEDRSRVNQKVFPRELEVLWEDEHLAVIYKVAGLEVSGNKYRTIENALPHNLAPSTEVDALPRPQAIHRLDHPTSGVLLIGKTRSAVAHLNQQFEQKEIDKIYHAICIGHISEAGTINEPIDGKESESRFEVIKRQVSPRFDYLNLLRLTPVTGRRHQLRKHLFGIGHPILGDKTYCLPGKIYEGRGLFLHASSIEFRHPVSGDRVTVTAGLPGKFGRVMG